ncbi:MAG: thermonuclease family protein [Candidatus Promineifilaceae bacterium]
MKQVWLLLLLGLLGCVGLAEEAAVEKGTAPEGDTAVVLNIIDGDTIDVDLNGQEYRLRYIGVDTPERDEPYYKEATEANRQLVDGQAVILVKDVSETDRYGRLLRYVYLPDGTFVNAELLRQGMARLVTFPPDVAQQAYFGQLQEEARTANMGLWARNELTGPCDCGKNRYNCADFSVQTDAQACFDFCLEQTGEDVHKLDGGGDGRVCESLP